MKTAPRLLVLPIVAIATLTPCGCVGRADSAGDARAPKAVRLVIVKASTGAESTSYSAIIAPNAQVDLAFRVPGYVVDIRQTKGADGRTRALEPGAPVTKGLTLARIRTTDYQAVVDKAQGSHSESSAGVSAAEAQLVEAQAAFVQAQSDFGRIATLWQQESATKPAYDGSKAKLDAARARVDSATAAIAAARQRAMTAAAQLDEARIALDDTALHAPFDGVLVERHVEIGTLIAPGAAAFTVADLHLVKARFSVPDSALDAFKAGQRLPLSVDAYATEPFQGHVLSVAPAADAKSRSFEIIVAIDNPAMRLRSGMIASIRAAREPADRPLVRIPIDALVHDSTGDRYLVYTVDQKDGEVAVAKAVVVHPGALVGNEVSILEGLTAGQRIVGSGANLLRPGDVVREVQ